GLEPPAARLFTGIALAECTSRDPTSDASVSSNGRRGCRDEQYRTSRLHDGDTTGRREHFSPALRHQSHRTDHRHRLAGSGHDSLAIFLADDCAAGLESAPAYAEDLFPAGAGRRTPRDSSSHLVFGATRAAAVPTRRLYRE